MLNRFVDNSQFSLIGSANNVNDQGFSGGGGGPRFRNSNGLTATRMLGANFATQTEKLELGGSARYNFSDRDATSTNSRNVSCKMEILIQIRTVKAAIRIRTLMQTFGWSGNRTH